MPLHLGDYADPSSDCAGLSKDPFLRPSSTRTGRGAYVAYGSKAALTAPKSDFRFTPESELAASPPLCPSRCPPQSVAACPPVVAGRILSPMGSKSRETIYGSSVRAAAERATEARKDADRLAVEAWNKRMLGFQGPAQPSPALGDALNAGYRYLEVKCLGCSTHQAVALDIVRRPKATPVHELERYMRCRQCSEVRGYPYKRSHLVALRMTKISASDPPSTWWPGER
jgi:hypothetical protein